jgi:hypothetical protein
MRGGDGVTARIVECAVNGRAGEEGVGVGRGRKWVDMLYSLSLLAPRR